MMREKFDIIRNSCRRLVKGGHGSEQPMLTNRELLDVMDFIDEAHSEATKRMADRHDKLISRIVAIECGLDHISDRQTAADIVLEQILSHVMAASEKAE